MTKYTIKNHLLFKDDVQVPFYPHEKRVNRKTIDVKFFTFHFTAGNYNFENTYNYLVNAETKADVQLVMSLRGDVVQLAPLNELCWHMGQSEYDGFKHLNNHACGIEVINPGPLDILPNGTYRSWFGQTYDNPDIIQASHHIHGGPKKGWSPYAPEQVEQLTLIAEAICHHYNAKFIGHDETTSRKTDPGPISPINQIRERIAGRGDTEVEEIKPTSTVESVSKLVKDNLPQDANVSEIINTAKTFLWSLFRR